MTEKTVKERPILFTADMANAILNGSKTMTRRVMKPQPPRTNWEPKEHSAFPGYWIGYSVPDGHGPPRLRNDVGGGAAGDCGWRCPYGKPGDHLYVREAFETMGAGCYKLEIGMPEFRVRFVAGGAESYFIEGSDDQGKYARDSWKRRPSIHMPKLFSRITLELLEVRVERVQEIAPEDVGAEGAGGALWDGTDPAKRYPGWCVPFSQLWDSINKGRGYGWDTNPWTWVLTFKRQTMNETEARAAETTTTSQPSE